MSGAKPLYNYPVKDLTRQAVAFRLMPNPAGDRVMVNCTSDERANAVISLFDASGRQVRSLKFENVLGEKKVLVDLIDLPQGIYMIRLRLKDPSGLYQENKKLVVAR